MMDLDLIRTRNPIVDMVREKFELKQSGTHFIGLEHDSLVVNPNMGWYHWNSRDEHGDVFDFTGRHLLGHGERWSARDPVLFMEVLEYLAKRAGIPVEKNNWQNSTYWAERQLVDRLHAALLENDEALSYATETRGWQTDTIEREVLGYIPNNKRSLLKGLDLPDKWKQIIQRFPGKMLVYIQLEKGRLVYLSGRSIGGKQHYNPPRDLVGERRPYFNRCYHAGCEEVVVVEGQADAITFSQWGIPAVALAGMSSSLELIDQLKLHKRVYVALDNTETARQKSLELARAIGVNACVPILPAAIKDANEWLVKQQATPTQVRHILNTSQTLLEAEVRYIEGQVALARQDAIDALIEQATNWEKGDISRLKHLMKSKLSVSCTYFNDMLKATRKDNEDEHPQIMSDDIPIISPALGFTHDMAVVTVSLMERTAENRLNIQPYLVTSQRELKRLDNQQIIQLDDQDVALRSIPEGTEFLMRWKYRDIQRFLQGEVVAPGEVYLDVHRLFSTYIDFSNTVDSHVVSLWVIGTYFYTLFMAYPYLALNGPKNSGKSTVLNVAKPLGFNMITTSDVTGPSLFRLIHHNSCTVGIDEAERYHKPRDPEMMQIRQLLNSGYKPGMPAIRLTGDDLKPQAFDVYSPKMLANIMGLEDILASRCIAIPMRRAAKKMPTFPPLFDGATIRHKLYTLALTHYPTIYENYAQRPDLHQLNNRSHELWSPLMALAAFFEEQGEMKD
ncbi:MAG: toprim domain-containing protein [Chloroflexi bacterium]|nr:toprim domain-containing protein [Chloroflexota bacterium]